MFNVLLDSLSQSPATYSQLILISFVPIVGVILGIGALLNSDSKIAPRRKRRK